VTADDRADRIRETFGIRFVVDELLPPGSVVLTADEAEQIKGAIRNLLVPWMEEAVGPEDAIQADCGNAEQALALLGEGKP
jgi:hypothetical protein